MPAMINRMINGAARKRTRILLQRGAARRADRGRARRA
jgi:hypothetical protein